MKATFARPFGEHGDARRPIFLSIATYNEVLHSINLAVWPCLKLSQTMNASIWVTVWQLLPWVRS